MGYSSSSAIERAGKHLLRRLHEATKLPYSSFYDGSDELHERLNQALGLEDDWYCAEHLIDLAAWQLEYLGIIAIHPLTTKLADDENDYLIQLTAEGRAKLAAGFEPTYYDAE